MRAYKLRNREWKGRAKRYTAWGNSYAPRATSSSRGTDQQNYVQFKHTISKMQVFCSPSAVKIRSYFKRYH